MAQAARENVIDITGIVCKIRTQRMKMVQSPVSALSLMAKQRAISSHLLLKYNAADRISRNMIKYSQWPASLIRNQTLITELKLSTL